MNSLTIFLNCPRVLLLVALLATLGTASLSQAQARYGYSVDIAGVALVTDAQTGLVWRRCSEGQSFSAGTCSGSATTHTHEQALALAKAQTGWRLPNVKELSSLIDRSRVSPSIDVTAFPATPSNWYWTSTPYAGDASDAWFVYFDHGYVYFQDGRVNFVHRYDYGHVRLVRQ